MVNLHQQGGDGQLTSPCFYEQCANCGHPLQDPAEDEVGLPVCGICIRRPAQLLDLFREAECLHPAGEGECDHCPVVDFFPSVWEQGPWILSDRK